MAVAASHGSDRVPRPSAAGTTGLPEYRAPNAYTDHALELWAPFATLVLEALYEATICAAIVNAKRSGNNVLFLTLIGGGAFGNELDWIVDVIRRSLDLYRDSGLDIAVVSYVRSKPTTVFSVIALACLPAGAIGDFGS